MNVISSGTRMMGLPYGEEIMIVGRTMWTQSTSVTDGRTDRITITDTVQRIASHGNKMKDSVYGVVIMERRAVVRVGPVHVTTAEQHTGGRQLSRKL